MDLDRNLDDISHILDRNGRNVTDLIRTVQRNLNAENRSAIQNSVQKIAKAAKLLSTGDGVDMFCGILIVLSSISMLNPVTGPVLGSVLGISSSVIHTFFGSGENVSDAVLTSINSALEKFSDSELQAKVAGAVHVYKTSFSFLDGPVPTNNDELKALMSNVKICGGVDFLGTLQHKIERHRKSKDKTEALRAIEYTKLYVKLAVFRTCLLQILHSTVLQTQNGDRIAERILNVLATERHTDKTLLTFLTEPKYSQVLFFVYLYPSIMPEVWDYLHILNLETSKVPQLSSFSFETKDFDIGLTRCWWGFRNDGEMTSTNHREKSEYSFFFEVISEVNSIFYIRTSKEPHLYVYMRNFPTAQCYACKDKPGPSGEWKVLKFKDGGYVFSTRKWPEWFLKGTEDRYMPHTDVGYNDDKTYYHIEGCKNDYSKFLLGL